MSKLLCVISSPVDTFSGYGGRSRDFIRAVIKNKEKEWDIKLLSQRWGSTPFGALDPIKDFDLHSRIMTNMDRQPDIWMQITVPNEFQPVGKYNIGVSALVETTVLPADQLEGMNRMNLNIVSSNHSKNIAVGTKFDKLDEHTKQKIGELSLEKPTEVLFEGIDTNVYQSKNVKAFDLSSIPESFCYLITGHMLSGLVQMEDRKMIGITIKTFLETFKNKRIKPALILKSSTGGYSHMDEEHTMKVVDSFLKPYEGKDIPNIYVIHGELEDEEMNGLYNNNKVKALISVGNEGYGRPEAEFAASTGKPVIASPYGGHIDFLDKEFAIYVGGNLVNVHESAANQFLLKESQWFKPDPMQLNKLLTDLHENYDKYKDNAKRLGYRCRTNFSFDKMVEALGVILDKNMPKMSIPVPIKLPSIKPVSLPESILKPA